MSASDGSAMKSELAARRWRHAFGAIRSQFFEPDMNLTIDLNK
jgi:hypothetical protein